MRVLVTMKSLAKRKNYLTEKEFSMDEVPTTLRELITEILTIEVHTFNNKKREENLINFLTQEELKSQAKAGKIGFSTIYNEQEASLEEAVNTGIHAFKDGLVRIFINEEEQTELDNPLNIHDGDHLMFIKLTMLAGRMW